MISPKLLCCVVPFLSLHFRHCHAARVAMEFHLSRRKFGLGLPSNGWHYNVPAPSRGNKSEKRVSMWRWLKINPVSELQLPNPLGKTSKRSSSTEDS